MKLKLLQVKEATGEMLMSGSAIAKTMTEEAKADRECFWVLHLDQSNKIIEKELVSIGINNSCLVHPREVFKKAILNSANSIITVHNHPSGNLEASKDDLKTWNKLDASGEILGIKVLDHIIITPGGNFYSNNQSTN